MASVFSHVYIVYGIHSFLANHPYWKWCLFFAFVLSILPDADVIGFVIGIPYGSSWGHRGASHSIVFSLLMAAVVCSLFFQPYFKRKRRLAAIFIVLSLAGISHGLLDAVTNGGLGVAFFWPFDTTRYFFPVRPIEVSPIGVGVFFSDWGVRVLLSELIFIILPTTVIMVGWKIYKKITK